MGTNNQNFFGCFIVTYEREFLLEKTIQAIFSQTFPPEIIWIIDNSESLNTKQMIEQFNHSIVKYYRVGYNAGPAGGVAIGLKIISDAGYQWIYWGDDDNPPKFLNTFEILLNYTHNTNNCGAVGSFGYFFDKKRGVTKRYPYSYLKGAGCVEVDNIPGDASKIVNGDMIRKYGTLIDSDLFFGFEELDFDLKVKRLGYKLLVDKNMALTDLENSLVINNREKNTSISNEWRSYYSYRNMLYILKKQKLYNALFALTVHRFKINVVYFFDSFSKGMKVLQYHLLAFIHFIFNKKGLTVKPKNKYLKTN